MKLRRLNISAGIFVVLVFGVLSQDRTLPPMKTDEEGRFTLPRMTTDEEGKFTLPPIKTDDEDKFTHPPMKTDDEGKFTHPPMKTDDEGKFTHPPMKTDDEGKFTHPPMKTDDEGKFTHPPMKTDDEGKFTHPPMKTDDEGKFTLPSMKTFTDPPREDRLLKILIDTKINVIQNIGKVFVRNGMEPMQLKMIVTGIGANEEWMCISDKDIKSPVVLGNQLDPICKLRFMQKGFCTIKTLNVTAQALSGIMSGKEFKLTLVWLSLNFPKPKQSQIKTRQVRERVFDTSKSSAANYQGKSLNVDEFGIDDTPSVNKCPKLPKDIQDLVDHDKKKKCVETGTFLVGCNGPSDGKIEIHEKRNTSMPTKTPPMNYTLTPKNGTVMDFEKSQTMFKRHVVKCADLLYQSVFITKNTSFTYIPPYNSKQNVTLKIRFGCLIHTTRGKEINRAINNRDDDDTHSVKVTIAIERTKQKPKCLVGKAFAPPIPADLSQNEGFPVEKLLFSNPKLYQRGFPDIQMKGKKLMEDNHDNLNAGIAIFGVNNGEIGNFQYKCGNGDFANIEIADRKVLLLKRNCLIRFKPEKEDVSNTQSVHLLMRCWDGSDNKTVGTHDKSEIDFSKDAYSSEDTSVEILRTGCDGRAGSGKKKNRCDECSLYECKPKCDNEYKSDAIQVCDECILGKTGKQINESKLFFENGEKKCCSQRLVCGRCPDRHPVKRDCNQDPICNRAFAAVKKCGVCVGGRTGRKPEDVLNSCGKCKSDANADEECASYISDVIPKSSHASVSTQVYQICGYAHETPREEINCELRKKDSDEKCVLEKTWFKRIIGQMECQPAMRKECISRARYQSCSPGNYTMVCTDAAATEVSFNEDIVLKEDKDIVITGIIPASASLGQNKILIAGAFSLRNRYFCKFGSMKPQMAKHNATHVLCQYFAKKVERNIPIKIISCANQSSNVLFMNVGCDMPMIQKVKLGKKFTYNIFFNQTVQKNVAQGCEDYVQITGKKIGVNSVQGNKISIPKKCFACPGSTLTDAPGVYEVSIPETKCAIGGMDVVSTCGNLKLNARMKKIKTVRWSVQYKNGNPADDNNGAKLAKLNATLGSRRGIFAKNNASIWSIHGRKFVFKMCAMNNADMECCAEKEVLVNSSIQAKIKFLANKGRKKADIKMFAAVKSCNARNLEYKWIVKENNEVLPLTSYERKFIIKQREEGRVNKARNLTVQLMAKIPDTNIMALSKQRNISIPAILLKIKLAGGRKKVYAKCDQKRFTIPSKLKAGAAAQFKWSCFVKGDDESDMSRCMENATKVLEFPNLPDLTVSPMNHFQCGGIYTIKLEYLLNKEAIDSQSIDVIVLDEAPPKIKCKPPKETKDDAYQIMCKVEGAKADAIKLINNIDDADFAVDLNSTKAQKTIQIKRVGKKIVKGGFDREVNIIKMHLKKEWLTENSKYKFEASAKNENGESEPAVVVVEHSGPPTGCILSVSPMEGIAFDTKFEAFVEGCSTGDDGEEEDEENDDEDGLEYQIGPVLDGKLTAEPFSGEFEQNLDVLPPGDGSRGELKIRAIVRNRKGKFVKLEKTVNCTKPNIENKEIFRQRNNETRINLENGNYEKAANYIAKTNEGVVKLQDEKNKDKTQCEQLSDEAKVRRSESAEQMAQASNPNLGKASVLSGVAALVRKNCPKDEIVSDNQKAAVVSSLKNMKEQKAAPARRRRRSLGEEEGNEEESASFVSEAEVLSFVETHNNLLLPVGYTDTDTSAKQDFIEELPYYLKSLCDSLISDPLNATAEHISLHASRLDNLTEMTLTTPLGDAIMINGEIANKYSYWNCSSADYCDGVFFVASSLTFDALSLTEPSSDFTLVSNLVKAEFANPTGEGVDGTYDFIQDESIPSNTKVTLDISAHNITGTVLCHVWHEGVWSSDHCSTLNADNMNGNADCKCYKHGFIAAFDVPEIIQSLEETTTTFAPTTNQQSVNSSVTITTTTRNDNSNPTTTTTTRSTTTKKISPELNRESTLSFKFNAVFNDVIDKFGNKTAAEKYICDTVRNDLKLNSEDIRRCDISSGSVIVVLVLYQNEEDTNSTLQQFGTLVQTNTFTVELPDGTKMHTIEDSALLNGQQHSVELPDADDDDEDDENYGVVIGVVVALLVVGVIIIIVIVVVVKQKKTKKVAPSPYPSYAQMRSPDTQEKQNPQSHAGYENLRQSPEGIRAEPGINNPTYNSE